jgi:hypothetical protein
MPLAALSLLLLLAACAGPRLPQPNTASGVSLVSGPHILYSPPPSVGLGIGGFGFSGCCSAFGSGVGFDVPVGKPSVAEVSDQYVASALIPAPGDYPTNWSNYRLEVDFGARPTFQPAPSPSS